jgi:hypothetical protein
MTGAAAVAGSFRDPSGFVFRRDGTLLRQVNVSYRAHYDELMSSGLYASLADADLLVPHEERDIREAFTADAYKVIRPEPIEFISYPYEWCFGQLKRAALTTLEVQRVALRHGMSLKDASAFNIQWRGTSPVLVDTLSFERVRPGAPWVAYRQFCQHFLAPLGLMAYRDMRLGRLWRVHIDGIPLDLAASLLPMRARLRSALLVHIFLHARHSRRFEEARADVPARGRSFSARAFQGLIDSLERGVCRLEPRSASRGWSRYYQEGVSYRDTALQHKKELVSAFIEEVRPRSLWDLGANTGLFARMAAEKGIASVSFDLDPLCVEANYVATRARENLNNLPLVMDLTDPSPALGWGNEERSSLAERGPADMALALALLHHIAIGNNVPLPRVARFLRSVCEWLVVEWIPKTDPRVRDLLATRGDIFPGYTQSGFESAFSSCFSVRRREALVGSARVIYLMHGR